MNRLVPLSKFGDNEDPATLTPMVVAGTHPLDLVMWFMAGKVVKRVYGHSIDKVFGPTHKGIDSTMGLIEMVDGSAANITMAWSLPTSWPGAVDSLHIGIIGTDGVFTVDDSHTDVIMAVNEGRTEGYASDSNRRVDFLGGYLAGDVALGQLRGPLREETFAWLNRLSLGVPTHHATVSEAHDCLMLAKAIDLSARLGRPVDLPLDATSERQQRPLS
jgi:myo-inositol 2-dehydrogenase/D-chiro-inositol 1-dehydrogenase